MFSRLWRPAWLLLLFVSLLPACGRKGPPMAPREVLPAAVGGLRAEPQGGAVLLSWMRPGRNTDGSPLTDLAEFRIWRAGDEPAAPGGADPGPLTTVRAERPENARLQGSLYVFRDDGGATGLVVGSRYRYRVQAVNRRGTLGALSPEVTVELALLPPAPVGLVARAGDGAVELEWQAPSAGGDRALGYNVYRGRQAGAYGEQPINAQPLIETRFRDAAVENEVTYHYAVRSVGAVRPYRRESLDSAEAVVTPLDFVAPAPPRHPIAIPEAGVIALTWDSNAEGDLLGYLVYRRDVEATSAERLTPAPIPGITFTDRTARSGVTYAYTVTAVDRSARRNESAPSAEVEARLP